MSGQGVFIRGDCNGDLKVQISDAITSLRYSFQGTDEPPCLAACDVNASGKIDITDPVLLLGFLFRGNADPALPFPNEDADDSGLPCDNGRLPVIELRVSPNRLGFFGISERRHLSVSGDLPDGGELDLIENGGLRFGTDPEGVVEVDEGGVVTSVAVGRTTISVGFRSLERTVEAEVALGADGSPRLQILQPQNGAVVTSPSMLVRGWTDDATSAVEVLGQSVDGDGPDESGFFVRRIDLSVGNNDIVATATNAIGTSETRVNVTLVDTSDPDTLAPDGLPYPATPAPFVSEPDVTPPSIAITSPASGAVLPSAVVEVRGTVSSGDGGADETADLEVRVNGVLALIEDGAFSVTLRLAAGDATIEATATDPTGNQSSTSVSVTIDASFPTISFTAPDIPNESLAELPRGFAWVADDRLHVEGVVSQTNMAVSVNGVPAAVNATVFSTTIPLVPGLQRVVAIAEDVDAILTGRRAAAVRQVFFDTSPPEVSLVVDELLGAGDDLRTPGSSYVLAGRLLDDSTAVAGDRALSLTADGLTVPVVGGRFSVNVSLQPFVNAVELVARDGAGRETRRTVTIHRDVPSEDYVEVEGGNGQTTITEADATQVLTVTARTVAGGFGVSHPVVFEVVMGDGRFDDGSTSRTVVADQTARASVGYRAGTMTGPNVIVARSPGGSSTPAVFSVHVQSANSTPLLVARWGRWRTGVQGRFLEEPIGVRAVDRFGNPIGGRAVSFDVASGANLLDGASSRTVSTDASGVAALSRIVPRSRLDSIVATLNGGAPVTFTVEGRVAGSPLDTAVTGTVIDASGQPVEGVPVRVVGLIDREVSTSRNGDFMIDALPWGTVELEIGPVTLPSNDGARTFAATRHEIFCAPGHTNSLPQPMTLVETGHLPALSSVFVSDTSSGSLPIAKLGGWQLKIPAGSVIFPDGATAGTITAAPASPRDFPVPSPDETSIEAAAWILPVGVRFRTPPRLVAPSFSLKAGQEPVLWSFDGSSGFFYAAGFGVVSGDGLSVISDRGIAHGGIHFFGRPGPRGGERGVIEGSIAPTAVLGDFVPQHADTPTVGVDVLVHSGEFVIDAADLTIRGRGLDFELTRHYESRQHFPGSLGWGWEQEYADRRLLPAERTNNGSRPLGPDSIRGNLLRGDGRGGYDEYLYDAATDSYVSPVGVFSRLFVDVGGAVIERTPKGTRYEYHAFDGTARSGRLARIADRNGNAIQFERDDSGRLLTVRDTLARSVNYAYNGSGFIESVTDFAGRVVSYGYDANGNLVSVTSPAVLDTPSRNDFPDGKTTRFSYDTDAQHPHLQHNVVAVFSPRESGEDGTPRLVNTYDDDDASPTFDRVVVQDWGGTNATGVSAGGQYALSYSLAPAPEGISLSQLLRSEGGTTDVVDPNGITRSINWNRLGLPMRDRLFSKADVGPQDNSRRFPEPGVDPGAFETIRRYSADGRLLTLISPGGNRTEYEYDVDCPLREGRARVVRETQYPAPGDLSPPVVRTTVADPLFGTTVKETDWYFEGDSPPDPTVRLLDYQEGTDVATLAADAGMDPADLGEALSRAGIQLDLGDRNPDGDTSRRSGDIIVVNHPTVTLPDGTQRQAAELLTWNRFGQQLGFIDGERRVTTFRYHPESDPEGDGNVNNEPGLDTQTGGFLSQKLVDGNAGGSTTEAPAAEIRTTYTYDILGNVATVTDALGNTTALTHNELGQLVEIRAPEPLAFRRQFHFDADDRLEKVQIENRSANENNFILPVIENPWIERTLERDLLGNVVADTQEISGGEVGPERSATTQYRYDANGGLIRAVHPEGNQERWLRDERGLILSHSVHSDDGDADATTEFLYDLNGNRIQTTLPEDTDGDGDREVVQTVYDEFGHPVVRVDEIGGTTAWTCDAAGRVVEEAVFGTAGGASPTDRNGAANVLLARTLSEYDERGRLFRTRRSRFGANVDPGSVAAEETFFLNVNGLVVRRVDGLGASWIFSYDGAGQLWRTIDPDNNSTTYEFDGAGNLVRLTKTERSSVPLTDAAPEDDSDYDGDGRLLDSQSTLYVHDALGRLLLEIGPSGSTRRWVYDSRDNVILTSDALGTVVGAGTDALLEGIVDLLTSQQSENANSHGNRVLYEYDNLDRPTRVTHELRHGGTGQSGIDLSNSFNADGLVTVTYEWDDNGRLSSWTNDSGFSVIVSRDELNRVSRLDGPGGMSTRLRRNLAGRPVEIVDHNGSVLAQSFDALGRLVRRQVTRPDGNGSASVEGTTLQLFEWDGQGRLTAAFDNNDPESASDDVLVTRTFDSLGHLAIEIQGGLAVSQHRDVVGRTNEIIYPGGRHVFLTRDTVGRVRSVSDDVAQYLDDEYLGPHRLLSRRLLNGVSLNYAEPSDDDPLPRLVGYQEDGRVVRHTWRDANGEVIYDYNYGYDRTGRRLFVRRLHVQGQVRGDASQYDSIGRLRRFIPGLRDPRNPPLEPTKFVRDLYDGNHNVRLTTENFINISTTVDDRDAVTDIISEVDAPITLVHDAAGNLTSDGDLEYRHDFLGRLVRVSRGDETLVKFAYDALGAEAAEPNAQGGRLATRDVLVASEGTTAGGERFVWLGDQAIELRRSDGALARDWIVTPGRGAAIAQSIDEEGARRTWYFLRDVLDTVFGVTDESAELVEQLTYDVYGAPTFRNIFGLPRPGSTTGNSLLYGGLLYDFPSGLYYVEGRFLSPALRRFVSARRPALEPIRESVLPRPPDAARGTQTSLSRLSSILNDLTDGMPVANHGLLTAPAPLQINPYVFSLNDPVNGIDQAK